MSTEKPTDEDYSRDLHEALVIAEEATPGPWWWEEDGRLWAEDKSCRGVEMTLCENPPDFSAEDKTAIASNRMAAPAAMRRAIEAEEAILEWYRQPFLPEYDVNERLEALAERILAARNGGETP